MLCCTIIELALRNVRYRVLLCEMFTETLSIAEDILVMKDASNRDWMWGTQVSEVDGKYVALYVNKDTSRVRTRPTMTMPNNQRALIRNIFFGFLTCTRTLLTLT